jgi:phage shock protein A
MFSRLGRVARGQANQGVGAIEDATFEATINQTVADMKTELNNVVRSSAVAMSNYNRLDAEYQKYVRQSQEWKDRAGIALDAGKEDLAKQALAKKAESDRQVASLQTAIDGAKAASEKLKQQVAELKRKIEEGERTATTLVARKNAASAQRKVAEAMAGVGKADNAFSWRWAMPRKRPSISSASCGVVRSGSSRTTACAPRPMASVPKRSLIWSATSSMHPTSNRQQERSPPGCPQQVCPVPAIRQSIVSPHHYRQQSCNRIVSES